jgi:putative membrane protein
MQRFSNALSPRATGLALAGLVAVSTLGLSACAEREETEPAATADGSAPATAPGAATQPGPATTPPPGAPAGGTLTEADRSFLAEALAANQHELQAAQLGLDKAQDEQVRGYAQRMQQDHSQLGNQMQPLVQQAGISMADPQMELTELETATGEAFDRAFMQMMVTDHRKAVSDFQRAANDPAHSAQVRSTATEALPVLQSHLQEATALAQQLGVELEPAPADGTTPPPGEAAQTPPTEEPAAADEGSGG